MKHQILFWFFFFFILITFSNQFFPGIISVLFIIWFLAYYFLAGSQPFIFLNMNLNPTLAKFLNESQSSISPQHTTPYSKEIQPSQTQVVKNKKIIQKRSRSRSKRKSKVVTTQFQVDPQKINNNEIQHYPYKRGEIFRYRYEAKALICDGTFGRVLRVFDSWAKQMKALKVIKAQKNHIKNAVLEYQILKQIQDSNSDHVGKSKIVKVFESFHHKLNYCLVFEELGLSLYELQVKNNHAGFNIPFIKAITKDVLEGLAFIHSQQLTHTDLKPENILLLDSELQSVDGLYYPKRFSAKIIDFGGATFADEHHSKIINTRQYRAPEVILTNGNWNEKSDIWCLACVIIEMYTGQLYFATRNNDLQHLAMIEKSSGFIPKTMISNCSEQMKSLFDIRRKNSSCLRWPSNQPQQSVYKVDKMQTPQETIPDPNLLDLILKMMQVEPQKRLSANELLKHNFFSQKN